MWAPKQAANKSDSCFLTLKHRRVIMGARDPRDVKWIEKAGCGD